MSTSSLFDPEFVARLCSLFEERIRFNQLLGLKLISLRPGDVQVRLDMRPQLVGHDAYGRLHGGVISTRHLEWGLACSSNELSVHGARTSGRSLSVVCSRWRASCSP